MGDPQNLWMFFVDANPDCGQQGPVGFGGIVVMTRNNLANLAGLEDVPLCPDGVRNGSSVTSMTGGTGHELGHALGLQHPPGCDDNTSSEEDDESLMCRGSSGYPDTYLLSGDKTILDGSQFFVSQMLGPSHIAAVANAAGFDIAGPVAPGSIVAIFGAELAKGVAQASQLPLPTSLLETRVSVGDTDIPLYYVSPNQINAQMPFELQTSESEVRVCVDDSCGDPKAVSIVATSPGLFTWPDGETAIAQDFGPTAKDWFLLDPGNVDSYALPGDFLVFYVSGLGQTRPPSETNTPATMPLPELINVPTISIGGRELTVLYGGLTVGFVGLYQINVQLPDDVMVGSAVPVVVTAGGRTSKVAVIPIR